MTAVRRVEDAGSAAALAELLNGDARTRPVAVVTIPASRIEPWIDAEELAREAGDLADVYLMPTNDVSWGFSNRMAEGTQVFGGAGRVYPVGHEWASDLTKSPLRFAFNEADGARATQHLISDVFRMAVAAGLVGTRTTRDLRDVTGVVKGVVAGRALVDIGTAFPATIAEELTVEGVHIDQLLREGQPIAGLHDPDSNRVDVTKSLRSAADALVGYVPGAVVLSKVTAVHPDHAELTLYPDTGNGAVNVDVRLADVTTNPLDDLDALMTMDEVIPARVVAATPGWALSLRDVDDDDLVLDAPSLLPGGPPWLVIEPEAPEPPAPAVLAPPAAASSPLPDPEVTQPPLPPTPKATPAMFDRSGPHHAVPSVGPATAAEPKTESTQQRLLQIAGLQAQVAAAEREKAGMSGQLRAASDTTEQLRFLLDQETRRANRAENELKGAKSRLRNAGKTKAATSTPRAPQFADLEQGFHYLVLTQWASRTPPNEQAARPLPGYTLGPKFLESFARLEGIKPEKVADVAFEILTGLAPEIASREVHHLRTGPGGDDPVRTREDGAVAWRASLQINTPSARRIHYWVLPNGHVELARVATHDEFEI